MFRKYKPDNMAQFEKEIVQAILIADNNVWNFKPLSDEGSTVGRPREACSF